MIIEPDFLDHWKTQLLVGLTQTATAPLWVIRLWGHCQMRKQSSFDNLTPEAIKAICRADLAASDVEDALTKSGFIERDASRLVVRGWDEYNSKLVANWNNGKRGGRNPTGTQLRVGVTHKEPIREEKIREEKNKDGASARPASVDEVRAYCQERKNSVDPQAWLDHYESNGWKVGKNAMKDWKAAVRNWERNAISASKPPEKKPFSYPPARDPRTKKPLYDC